MPRPILHVLATPGEVAGMPRAVEESAAAVVAAGGLAEVVLALPHRLFPSPLPARFRARSIPLHVITADTWADPRGPATLIARLRSMPADTVLHSHGERALLWARLASIARPVPHVHTLHGAVENDAADRTRIARAARLQRGADLVTAVDPAVGSLTVLPNCLDPARLADAGTGRELIRRRLGLAADDRMALFLGRLAPEKGADLLASVQASLQRRSARTKLFVAGRGPLFPGVDAMEDVRALGDREDAASILAAADVLLMPSRSEGLPMVALEAAALGIPVAAFPAGGLASSGLAATVSAGDVEALVELALRLVRDPSARAAVLARSQAALLGPHSPRSHLAALDIAHGGLPARAARFGRHFAA